MEVTALCFRLMTAMVLLWTHDQKVYAASLHISPNRLQFFMYEQVTIKCEAGIVQGDILNGKSPSCGRNRKTTPTGPTCTIKHVYPEDSGEYWCEAGGVKRNIVNITVTAGSVILESPALPVMEGESVTLSCRDKMASSSFTADFYKDGSHINSSSTGNVALHKVSMSDEGLYKCNISGVGESAESRLAVREVSNLLSSGNTPWIVVAVSFTLVLVVMGLICYKKAYWNRVLLLLLTVMPSGSGEDQTVSEEASGAEEPRYAVVARDRKEQDVEPSRPMYCTLDIGDPQLQAQPELSNFPSTSAPASRPLDPFYSEIR